jgi:hypothetical protein
MSYPAGLNSTSLFVATAIWIRDNIKRLMRGRSWYQIDERDPTKCQSEKKMSCDDAIDCKVISLTI